MDADAIQRKQVLRRLYTATILCSCFIVVEVAGGLISGSLAILSDAAHLFADLASFAVAIAASYLASLPATPQHTFGLKRSESLAALFSMVSLAFVSAGLAYEAIRRLIEPPEQGVDGTIMTMIAGIGVLVNLILAWVLGENHVHLPGGSHDHSHDHGGHHDGHDHGHGHAHEKYGHRTHDGDEQEKVYGHDHSHEDNHHAHDHEHSNDKHGDNGKSCNGYSHDHSDHTPASTPRASEATPLIVPVGSPDRVEFFDAIEERNDHDSDDYPHVLSHEDQRNVNLRAAYLHVMADLAQSVAVFVGGVFIWLKPEWHMIDPILTLGFCILVLYNTLGVLRSSIQVLLEEIPPSVDWRLVFNALSKVPNVSDVHDLHIWCISHGQTALSLHCTSSDPDALYNINKVCVKFGIKHTTIQVQTSPGPCPTCTSPECCTSHLSNRNSISL
ncbi:cation efflux protein [Nitzschia inconspicua]|uniref:Cation efflux protein n=1 Tax=Nitzschia inconspicua TaxID=303405 RepID=A0A9K3KT55_9STRA|nr:cation efflux protein [Nitzschia inconspicua]